MASVERALISRVVARSGDLPLVLQKNVKAYHFHDEEMREVWEYIIEHYSEYGQGPDREAIGLEFGQFRYGKPGNTTQFYVDKLLEDHRHIRVQETLAGAVQLVRPTQDGPGDHEGALKLLHEGIVQIEQETSLTDDTDTSDLNEVIARYRSIEEGGTTMTGIPTGFAMIDEVTGGLQPEQFVVIGGPQKSGKSSMLLRMAQAAQEAEEKTLFFGFEMSNREQEDRYISSMAGVSLFNMTHGKMTAADWRKINAVQVRVEKMTPIVWVHDMRRTTTLSGIEAKIDQYAPDLVCIDGMYMMDAEVDGTTNTDTKALTVLSRGLKRMAQNLKITVVGTTQALEHKYSRKRGGMTTSALAYTSAFGQDGDLIIGVDHTDVPNRRVISILDARHANRRSSSMLLDWDTGVIEEDATLGGDDYDDDDLGLGD